MIFLATEYSALTLEGAIRRMTETNYGREAQLAATEIFNVVQGNVGYMGHKQMRHAANVLNGLLGIVDGSPSGNASQLAPKDALSAFSRAVKAFTAAWDAYERHTSHKPDYNTKRAIKNRLQQALGVIINNPSFKIESNLQPLKDFLDE